ncbi:hypothetical protein HK101_008114, partial [Irineochytrium annulatum]
MLKASPSETAASLCKKEAVYRDLNDLLSKKTAKQSLITDKFKSIGADGDVQFREFCEHGNIYDCMRVRESNDPKSCGK